jgi:drug/metabolite transporter (DMT)-like permease
MDWLFLLLLGVLTQLAQVFMTKGIQGDLAGNTMSYKYVGVLFALVYGYLFFGETYSVFSVFGILLLLLGVVLNMIYKNKEISQ